MGVPEQEMEEGLLAFLCKYGCEAVVTTTESKLLVDSVLQEPCGC